jgi:hypothetical protein
MFEVYLDKGLMQERVIVYEAELENKLTRWQKQKIWIGPICKLNQGKWVLVKESLLDENISLFCESVRV